MFLVLRSQNVISLVFKDSPPPLSCLPAGKAFEEERGSCAKQHFA
jgi:hypothetical protein